MAFAAQYTDSQLVEFRGKVHVAMAKTAVAIVGEAASANSNTDNKRHKLGVQVLRDPAAWIEQFSIATVSDDATNNSSTDAAVESRISAIWNDIAGIGSHEGVG